MYVLIHCRGHCTFNTKIVKLNLSYSSVQKQIKKLQTNKQTNSKIKNKTKNINKKILQNSAIKCMLLSVNMVVKQVFCTKILIRIIDFLVLCADKAWYNHANSRTTLLCVQ